MNKADRWLVAFIVVGAVECLTELMRWMDAAFVLKATLMPLLAAWVWARLPPGAALWRRRMGIALAGSWVGDVALMLAPGAPDDKVVLGLPKHDAWFLVGVAGFFVAHLAWMSLYRRVSHAERLSLWPDAWAWFAPLGVYGLLIGGVVVRALAADPVKALAAGPVAVYGATLVGMVGVALNRRGRVSKTSFGLVFGGALVFLLSDSLIGLHFLVAPGLIPAGGFWIMLTYLVAEGMIAAGLIIQAEADFGARRA